MPGNSEQSMPWRQADELPDHMRPNQSLSNRSSAAAATLRAAQFYFRWTIDRLHITSDNYCCASDYSNVWL